MQKISWHLRKAKWNFTCIWLFIHQSPGKNWIAAQVIDEINQGWCHTPGLEYQGPITFPEPTGPRGSTRCQIPGGSSYGRRWSPLAPVVSGTGHNQPQQYGKEGTRGTNTLPLSQAAGRVSCWPNLTRSQRVSVTLRLRAERRMESGSGLGGAVWGKCDRRWFHTPPKCILTLLQPTFYLYGPYQRATSHDCWLLVGFSHWQSWECEHNVYLFIYFIISISTRGSWLPESPSRSKWQILFPLVPSDYHTHLSLVAHYSSMPL